MALNSYAALKSSLTDWLARLDSKLVTHADDFITLGEVRIWDRVRLAGGLSASTLTILAGASSASLPADFLQLNRVWAAGYDRMVFVPMDTLIDEQAAQETNPRHYSNEGGLFYWSATATVNTVFNFNYYKRPAPLSTAVAGDLWLLAAYPNIYLYAALLEAAIFMKQVGQQDRTAQYGSLLDKAIADAESADLAKRFPRGQRLELRKVGG